MPKSDEIKRYHWTKFGMNPGSMPVTGDGWVTALSATAALEAQAEEHRKQTSRIRSEHADLQDRAQVAHECELAALRGEGEPALIQFEHAALHEYSAKCMIHRDFRPAMVRLCNIAARCDVKIFVTHSMRRLNQKLVGAIVEAAERSNHYAGSAVDLNPVYQDVWYTNEKMKDFVSLPLPVRNFLNAVTHSPDLRWGGSFGVNKDRVHFDDNLVLRDAAEWQRRVEQLRE